MTTKARLFLILPLASLFLVLGCRRGNPNAPVSVTGKVSYKGQPVTAGTLVFHTDSNAAYPGTINSDGTYAAHQIPSGPMVVTIETESANPGRKMATYGGGKGKGMLGPMPEGRTASSGGAYVKIPSKYADKKTSPLKVTLTDGKQTHDFELTD